MSMSADQVYSVANYVLIFALVLGVIATFAIVQSGDIRDRNSQTELADSKERTARLESDAASAKLQQETLKAQLAWRELSSEQLGILQGYLKASPQIVRVQYVANDPEALNLAIQISKAFQAAHWRTEMDAATYANALITGIFVPSSSGKAAELVQQAFTDTEISFSTDTLPPPGFTLGSLGLSNVTVFVGSKAPPVLP